MQQLPMLVKELGTAWCEELARQEAVKGLLCFFRKEPNDENINPFEERSKRYTASF
jgi:hypothetical protein